VRVNKTHKLPASPQITFHTKTVIKTITEGGDIPIFQLSGTNFRNRETMSSSFKSKKKPELQALAADLKVDTDGSKADLEARILQHLSEHTELKGDPKYSKYFNGITGPESPGAAGAVASGSIKRRSIAAKKSTDLGETISKALTRFIVYIRVSLTCLVMKRVSWDLKSSRKLKGWQTRLLKRPNRKRAISWILCPAPFQVLHAYQIRLNSLHRASFVALVALQLPCNFIRSPNVFPSSDKQLAMSSPSMASSVLLNSPCY
jgi:hypothetical protein